VRAHDETGTACLNVSGSWWSTTQTVIILVKLAMELEVDTTTLLKRKVVG